MEHEQLLSLFFFLQRLATKFPAFSRALPKKRKAKWRCVFLFFLSLAFFYLLLFFFVAGRQKREHCATSCEASSPRFCVLKESQEEEKKDEKDANQEDQSKSENGKDKKESEKKDDEKPQEEEKGEKEEGDKKDDDAKKDEKEESKETKKDPEAKDSDSDKKVLYAPPEVTRHVFMSPPRAGGKTGAWGGRIKGKEVKRELKRSLSHRLEGCSCLALFLQKRFHV